MLEEVDMIRTRARFRGWELGVEERPRVAHDCVNLFEIDLAWRNACNWLASNCAHDVILELTFRPFCDGSSLEF